MPKIEIYYDDLNEIGQRKIIESGMYHENIDLCPLAILEIELEDILDGDDEGCVDR